MSWARLIIYHKSATFGILLAIYLKFTFNPGVLCFYLLQLLTHQGLSLPLNRPISAPSWQQQKQRAYPGPAQPRAESQALGTRKVPLMSPAPVSPIL